LWKARRNVLTRELVDQYATEPNIHIKQIVFKELKKEVKTILQLKSFFYIGAKKIVCNLVETVGR